VNSAKLWGDAWFTYDALDNLTTSQLTGGATARKLTHTIDPVTNLLTGISNSAGATYSFTLQYDGVGNVKQRGAQSFVFDLGNRLRSAPGKGTYAYDGLGHRVSVVGVDGVNRIQVYSQDGKLLYVKPSNAPTGTRYIHLHNHVIAEATGSSVVYDHTDGLGSPVALTDATGKLISRTRYEPYGLTAAGPTPVIGFTGHVNAADIGLVYMQQRYYDPVAGRFLSIDPVVTDATSGKSFNRYVYANNNPFKYIDPDGRDAAERFVEQHRRDMEAGNGDVYKPLAPIALAGGGIALAATGAAAGAAAGPPLLAAVVKVLAPKVESIAGKELTKQELKSVKSLAKQMEKHEQKLEDFKTNPTVRPGMEHMPQERIQAQQAQRAEDIKVEIQRNFVDKIMDILGH
jgi:RHS repeat-associated protein